MKFQFAIEQEKCEAGLLYNIGTPERDQAHVACMDLCHEFNHTLPSDKAKREEILRKLFGRLGAEPYIEPNIFCGFGFNIEAGNRFFVNNNCVFIDPGKIVFGDDVLIGPQCGFYTAIHPLDGELRREGYEVAKPILVGNNVWFGGHVSVLPGVTIGDNTVIGAGSVVTRDIPGNVLAVGNPCRVIRQLEGMGKCRNQIPGNKKEGI